MTAVNPPPATRARLALVVVASLCAALVLSVGLTRPARAHSAVNSAHSVAFGADGSQLLTVSFGLVHRGVGAAPAWLCPTAFGASKPALNRAVVAHGDAYFLLSDGGVYRSQTGACPWQPQTLPAGTAIQLASADGGLWALLDKENSSVLVRFVKNGWTPVALPKQAKLAGIHAGPGAERVWATGQQGEQGTVWLSDDGGATWATHALPKAEFEQTTFTPLTAHPVQADLLLVRAASALKVDRLLGSTDGGVSWQLMLAPNAGIDLSSAVWLPSKATGTLFVGSASAGMWRDDGAGLTKMAGAPRIGCLAHHQGRVYACTDEFAWGASLLGSDDAGKSWTPSFCFAEITGAHSCAPTCAGGWADVVAEHGIQTGKACGGGTATWMDGFSGADGGAVSVADGSAADTWLPPGSTPGGGAVAAKPKDAGCQASPLGRTPLSQRPIALSILCLVALVGVRLVRRRPSS